MKGWTSGNSLAAVIVLVACSAAQAATPGFESLYSFTGGNDGGPPSASVVIGPGGILYGTTFFGGPYVYGVVFSLTPPSFPGSAWVETVLHSSTGASDGLEPAAPLVLTSDGVLYGTTIGGAGSGGVVYSLSPPTSPGGAWIETVLYSFVGGDDGATDRQSVTNR